MSEKSSSSEPAVESDEELEETARGSEESIWKEIRKMTEYKPRGTCEAMARGKFRSPDFGEHDYPIFQRARVPKLGTLIKVENSEAMKMCQQFSKKEKKTMEDTEDFIDMDSEDSEDPEVPKICQLPKATSEISTSNKPEDPEDPKVAKICICPIREKKQIPEDSENPEDPEVLKICQLPKTTSEISTSNKPEDPEDPKVAKICICPMRKKKQIPEDSEDPEDPEVLKICRLPKTTSEISTSNKPEDPEDPEVPKICQLPKTISEISTSIEEDIPKVPKACQLPKTSEISTIKSVKFENFELPNVCSLCSTPPFEISPVKFPEISECQLPKAMSEIPTSIELETSKIPEICQLPKTVSEISTSMKSEAPKVLKASQMRKTTSEIFTYGKDPDIPEQRRACSISELMALKREPLTLSKVCEFPTMTCKVPTFHKLEDSETLKKEDSDSDDSISDYIISEQTIVKRVPPYSNWPPRLPNESDREFRIRVVEQMKPIGYFDNELEEIRHLTRWTSLNKSESLKKSEESSLPDDEDKTELEPIISGKRPLNTLNKFWAPLGTPNLKKRPLVLATYQLVPSLPIGLFEMFAEIIEYVTMKPVVLLHECRFHRPIPSEIADIVIMPSACNWDEGVLLPASFVFKHEQNKEKTANVYADVIVAKDCAPHIKNIINLRGHTFVLPIQRGELTTSDLLFNFLHAKGENLLFFGNILDARTQIDVLDMVANNRAEAGVLDSPVVESNKYNIQGVTMKSLRILSSLGPLPPYRIMVKKTLEDKLVEKLASYLLRRLSDLWLERLLPYGVLGFAENSMDKYEYLDPKAASRTPRYY